MQHRIAFFTIGESPRSDIVPEMQARFGSHIQVQEFGALDGLSEAARAELAPVEGQHRFATRLRDGSGIQLDARRTEARLAQVMREADAQGFDVLVPLCTGTEIPAMQTLVVEPQQVVDLQIAALSAHCRRLGVVVPLAVQTETLHLIQPVACAVELAHASPYEADPEKASQAFKEAGRKLADCDLVVMHCMGYTEAMRSAVASKCGCPVLLSNRMVADVLAHMLG